MMGRNRKALLHEVQLIHAADPQSHILSVRSCTFQNLAKQISSESNVHYWRDSDSDRVDH